MTLSQLSSRLAACGSSGVNVYAPSGARQRIPYKQLGEDARQLAGELRAAGIGQGDAVGIIGANSYAWMVCDLALLELGCISVAFAAEALKENSLEELASRYELDGLLFTGRPPWNGSIPEWAACVERRPLTMRKRTLGKRRGAYPADAFSLAFSSGTTGTTKGLVMSREGIENTVVQSGEAWHLRDTDNILLFMPFSSFQQRTCVYTAIWYRCDVTIVGPERLFRAMRDFGPTVMIVPPSALDTLQKQSGSGSRFARRARMATGSLVSLAGASKMTRAIQRLLFWQLHWKLGGNMRLVLVGSAPSSTSMLRFFSVAGVPVYEVYGVTEFGWIAFNLPGKNRIGAVGRPLPGVRVEFGEDGELIVCGAHPQTIGYRYDGEEEQSAVYLPARRIATGDTGFLDDDGYLRLTGRKKNVIVTNGGQKMNPEVLEARLQELDGVSRAAVLHDDGKAALACVVWLEDQKSSRVRATAQAGIEELNQTLPAHQRIGRVLFRGADELTVESGFLTRNFKLNRPAVLRHLCKEQGAASATS